MALGSVLAGGPDRAGPLHTAAPTALSPPEIVLVRHGETEWSRDGRHTGRTDIPLTQTGKEQAKAIGPVLKHWHFSLVLTSPLKRAEETCRLAGFGSSATIDPDLSEWDYGRYEGITSAQIHDREPGWSLWRDGCPAGEQPEEVGRRADGVVTRLAAASANCLIFSHGHFLRVLTARWLGLPAAAGRYFALATASISVLGYEHEDRVMREWNIGSDIGRLYGRDS